MKIQIPILFNISVLLDVQANLPETSPFFVSQNSFGEHLFSNVYSTWDVQLWGIPGKQIALPSLSWINKVEHDFHVDFMFEHMAIEFTTSVPKTRVPTQNILWYLETNLPQWPNVPNFHLKIMRTFFCGLLLFCQF